MDKCRWMDKWAKAVISSLLWLDLCHLPRWAQGGLLPLLALIAFGVFTFLTLLAFLAFLALFTFASHIGIGGAKAFAFPCVRAFAFTGWRRSFLIRMCRVCPNGRSGGSAIGCKRAVGRPLRVGCGGQEKEVQKGGLLTLWRPESLVLVFSEPALLPRQVDGVAM